MLNIIWHGLFYAKINKYISSSTQQDERCAHNKNLVYDKYSHAVYDEADDIKKKIMEFLAK